MFPSGLCDEKADSKHALVIFVLVWKRGYNTQALNFKQGAE